MTGVTVAKVHAVTTSRRSDPLRRNGKALAVVAAALIPMLAACSGSPSNQPPGASGSAAPNSGHGPFFPQCGGISDQTVSQVTQTNGLMNTSQNSVGCQWLGGGILGAHFSFTWYRGSPIGRERKTEELSRNSVDDINIEGHNGFIAMGTDPVLGNNLCEIAIGFQNDFIEWSISFAQQPFPDPCQAAKELARQSIANSK